MHAGNWQDVATHSMNVAVRVSWCKENLRSLTSFLIIVPYVEIYTSPMCLVNTCVVWQSVFICSLNSGVHGKFEQHNSDIVHAKFEQHNSLYNIDNYYDRWTHFNAQNCTQCDSINS